MLDLDPDPVKNLPDLKHCNKRNITNLSKDVGVYNGKHCRPDIFPLKGVPVQTPKYIFLTSSTEKFFQLVLFFSVHPVFLLLFNGCC